jgi:hypothetical protein
MEKVNVGYLKKHYLRRYVEFLECMCFRQV